MIFPIIKPSWLVGQKVQALTTTRQGGVSLPPYASLNLANHVDDQPEAVAHNRAILQQAFAADLEWAWLNQQHTTHVVHFNQACLQSSVADVVWSDLPNQVCAVMTADCLPILLTNQAASLVAAVHAGWRGLADGIIPKTLEALPEQPQNLIAWIGPAISQAVFEVGQEVVDAFLVQSPDLSCFFVENPAAPSKFFADLPGIAQDQLKRLGVERVSLSGRCSYGDATDFFSYRRDGQTGRMVSAIWLKGTSN